METRLAAALLLLSTLLTSAPLPPLVCPAGGPLGAVDLRVASARGGSEPLPLRTINRIEEGDTILYRPILRSGEERKGEVSLVLVPANRKAADDKLVVLEPKDAGKPQQWQAPWRVAVVAFVYGPSGLNAKKVRTFFTHDDDLVAQLADYAEKTSQTEALIAAISSPNSSAASVQSALTGFSSQYGLSVQIDRTATSEQQAMTLFRTLNPAIAGYDPISPQGSGQLGQTARLATSVATLFFGSPVGLAAGGTAMVLELRALAFPKAEFRSSLSQLMPDDGLAFCGRRDPAAPHTRVAYLWANRIPNLNPPQLSIDKSHTLPASMKSPLPLTSGDPEWKYIDHARNWVLQPESGKPIPIKVQKLGDTKQIELDLGPQVKAGKYTLAANWDWDHFQAKGVIEVKPLSDFNSARLGAVSQDLLVARTGKVPVTLEGSDFEFVTKVEVEKVNDKFASPAPVPFILPVGLRQGSQDRMDVQVNTFELDPGNYKLLLTQLDGKAHAVNLKVLPAPPRIESLPMVLNQGSTSGEFVLKGQRLDLLKRLEVARGKAELSASCDNPAERKVTLHMSGSIAAGTSLALKAFIEDRNEALTFADAVRIVGPLPSITEVRVTQPPGQDVQLEVGELPGGTYLSAMMRIRQLQSNSVLRLGCSGHDAPPVSLKLGERSGPLSLQQLAPEQVFVSFDSSVWPNGCILEASIANGKEGVSDPHQLGRIVRVPAIEQLDQPSNDGPATITGENLETIERAGWSADVGEAVLGLPLPIVGAAPKQTLQIRLTARPDPHAPLFLWLRGELKPRETKLR